MGLAISILVQAAPVAVVAVLVTILLRLRRKLAEVRRRLGAQPGEDTDDVLVRRLTRLARQVPASHLVNHGLPLLTAAELDRHLAGRWDDPAPPTALPTRGTPPPSFDR